MSSSPLALYRSLLRLSRQLPDDTARFASFRGHVVSRARNAIRAHREATGADREQLLKNGWKEYDALKAILGNKTRDEFPLNPSGPILSNLPPKERFRLLDTDTAEKVQKEKSQVGFLVQDLKRWLRN